MEDVKQANLKEAMSHVEAIFEVVHRYELSRPVGRVIDKLEDTILWLQVLVNQVPVKEKKQEEIGQKKDEIADAA